MYYRIHIHWYNKRDIVNTQKVGHFVNRVHARKVLDGIVKMYKPVYRTNQTYVFRNKNKTGRVLAVFALMAYREEGEIGYESCKFYPCFL